MKCNKDKIFSIVLVSLACILFIVAIILMVNKNDLEFTNSAENKVNMESQLKDENVDMNNETSSNNFTNDQENENSNINSTNETSIINSNIVEEDNEDSNNDNASLEMDSFTSINESTVISYFETQESMITAYSNQEDGSLREKVKTAFVTIIDFIFYDREIGGYTFSQLTTNAKLKVIKIALSIDYKVDAYFPNYKDTIKDKYQDIKGKLAMKYLEFTSNLCETVGIDTCNQAKEDFNTMKESFGFTWQLIKELASSGSSKVKEFYESWRESE